MVKINTEKFLKEYDKAIAEHYRRIEKSLSQKNRKNPKSRITDSEKHKIRVYL